MADKPCGLHYLQSLKLRSSREKNGTAMVFAGSFQGRLELYVNGTIMWMTCYKMSKKVAYITKICSKNDILKFKIL